MTIHIKGAPNYYACEENILETLPAKLAELNWTNGLLIHGDASWKAASPFLDQIDLPVKRVAYNGHCTHAEAARLANIATEQSAQFIIGTGGGKVLDTAKAAANEAGLPVILIPTIVSNCSPWASLSVFYDEAGNFAEYTIFPRSTFMVLVEPRLLLTTPVPYLIAGIGDTLAKWYEADALTEKMTDRPLAVQIARNAAKLCRDVLIAEGDAAILSLQHKRADSAFLRVAETVIMAGGMVGGFGDSYGRIAGAHSIHNGLTRVAATHDQLHGNKVAYGILVQLALEEKFEEIQTLLPIYRKLGLPTGLQELGVTENAEQAMKIAAEAAVAPGESIHFMHVSSSDAVMEAMHKIEAFASTKQGVKQ
ncbi:iron-containing alcohol dehydrogenase family protein [Terribacillus saccharophilus]|uniref:iron-containing alcohol dehydrogenase family protein n=1 Tax=Terribacillus saccharophilus TaxID=361277 RepID=UPI003981A106